jgi:hypothetical protein
MFSADGYVVSPTNPVYLSFDISTGHLSDDLEIWRYDESTSDWTKYAATDLTYDGTYASFTATSFNGFAVTAVPEPGALALLAAGLSGVLAYARRKQKWPQGNFIYRGTLPRDAWNQ